MDSIKVVMQEPGEISRVISIQKDNINGEFNRLVGGLSTMVMTDCGLWLVIHSAVMNFSDRNLMAQWGLVYGTALMTATDETGQHVSLTPAQVQTARSWLLRHSF